jgi:hypothetical protein
MKTDNLAMFIPLKLRPDIGCIVANLHLCMGRIKKKGNEEKNGYFFHGLNLKQDKN